MNFYLIIPVSSIELGGRFTKYKTTGAAIYHIYQHTSNKTRYNVFNPSYSPNRHPWPRKKLTRRTLDKCFYLPMYCRSINANNIDELAMELNIHSDIYKVVI